MAGSPRVLGDTHTHFQDNASAGGKGNGQTDLLNLAFSGSRTWAADAVTTARFH